jgi:hypothetical protein
MYSCRKNRLLIVLSEADPLASIFLKEISMLRERISLVILVAVLLLSLTGWTAYTQKNKSSNPRWEYKTIGLQSLSIDENQLNTLGAQGWEFVGLYPVLNGNGGEYYIFKRPKQ